MWLSQEERLFIGDTVSFLRTMLANNMSVSSGFAQSLVFLKKSLNLPSNFPEIKSGQNGKKSCVFFKATTSAL